MTPIDRQIFDVIGEGLVDSWSIFKLIAFVEESFKVTIRRRLQNRARVRCTTPTSATWRSRKKLLRAMNE
jgi:hypothetical protein